jgi:hypothetical protein
VSAGPLLHRRILQARRRRHAGRAARLATDAETPDAPEADGPVSSTPDAPLTPQVDAEVDAPITATIDAAADAVTSPDACVPLPAATACAGLDCGEVSDGCNGMVSCWPEGVTMCPGTGATCGGGGKPRVCGCTRTRVPAARACAAWSPTAAATTSPRGP